MNEYQHKLMILEHYYDRHYDALADIAYRWGEEPERFLLNDLYKHAKSIDPKIKEVLLRLSQGGWTLSDLDSIQSIIDSEFGDITQTTIDIISDYAPIDSSDEYELLYDKEVVATNHEILYSYIMGELS